MLLVVWPAYMARYGERDLARMGEADGRLRDYWITIATQWAHTLALLGLWIWTGRTWSALGLGLEATLGFWIVTALTLVLLIYLGSQMGPMRRDLELRAKLRDQMGDLVAMLPTNGKEARLCHAMAVTAGVCEELAYRGFLLWYLGAWLQSWAAVAIAGVAFGAVHLYQGRAHALRVVGLGWIACSLFILSGSLWPLIILHAGVDVLQIRLGTIAFQADSPHGSAALAQPPGQSGA